MTDRATLHRSKQGLFERWLAANGWALDRPEPMPPFQVVRARKEIRGRKEMLVVYDRNGGDHLSVDGRWWSVIRQFIESANPGRRP